MVAVGSVTVSGRCARTLAGERQPDDEGWGEMRASRMSNKDRRTALGAWNYLGMARSSKIGLVEVVAGPWLEA